MLSTDITKHYSSQVSFVLLAMQSANRTIIILFSIELSWTLLFSKPTNKNIFLKNGIISSHHFLPHSSLLFSRKFCQIFSLWHCAASFPTLYINSPNGFSRVVGCTFLEILVRYNVLRASQALIFLCTYLLWRNCTNHTLTSQPLRSAQRISVTHDFQRHGKLSRELTDKWQLSL